MYHLALGMGKSTTSSFLIEPIDRFWVHENRQSKEIGGHPTSFLKETKDSQKYEKACSVPFPIIKPFVNT